MPSAPHPRTIAVDLTPLLPGGENGGAKVLTLELVRNLAAMNPDTQFVLLTQAASNDELAALERANVKRLCVVGAATSAVRTKTFTWAAAVLARLPNALRARAARVGYRLHQLLKRGRPRSFLRDLHVELLFCPFTAP